VVPATTPSTRAEAHRAQGGPMRRRTHRLRHLTGRSCLNGAAQPRSEFCGPTLGSSTAGCPLGICAAKPKGTRVAGCSFLCLLSFEQAKESKSPPRDKRPARFQAVAKLNQPSSAYPASASSYRKMCKLVLALCINALWEC